MQEDRVWATYSAAVGDDRRMRMRDDFSRETCCLAGNVLVSGMVEAPWEIHRFRDADARSCNDFQIHPRSLSDFTICIFRAEIAAVVVARDCECGSELARARAQPAVVFGWRGAEVF